MSSDPLVVVFATVGWERVVGDPMYDYFHSLFCSQIDPESLRIINVESAFHPFAFLAKLQSQDFRTYSYQEVLRMDKEKRLKWMQALDNEISDLAEREAFQLVPRSEPLSKSQTNRQVHVGFALQAEAGWLNLLLQRVVGGPWRPSTWSILFK